MTRRENLLRLLSGQKPAWVPCSINFSQWYLHHQKTGTLPEELRGTRNLLDALKVLGCDIFSRNIGGHARGSFDGVTRDEQVESGSQGPRHIGSIQTPHGELRRISEEQTALASSYTVEDLVKDWQQDGAAYLWLMERYRMRWDAEAFAAIDQRVGDDGLVLVNAGCTPLKHIHRDFGLDYGSMFMIEEPEAATTVCNMYWREVMKIMQQLRDHPRVHAVILMDNVDSPFYSPSLCEQYWTPYVKQAAELLEASGKRLFVHACGKLRVMKDVFRAAHVHGLEGMAHAPLGDFEPSDALDMPEYFIYNGGFSAHEQVSRSDQELEAFYRGFFQKLGGNPRFIFGAACQTAIDTPWERIKLAVELCRKFGGDRR